jgi:protein involved in polysaccharide export with SLBB domain
MDEMKSTSRIAASLYSIKTYCVAFAAMSGCLAASGCVAPLALREVTADVALTDIPRELQKVSIPPYRVETPDILSIESVNNIRPAGDPLRAGDDLGIRVAGTLPLDPSADPIQNDFKQISGIYRVQTDGTVDLGPEYGSVVVEGLTVKGAKAAIDAHLRREAGLNDPKVAVSLPNVNGKQLISGEHIIRPDGTVALGIYGSVYVNGMMLDEVKAAVEEQLSRFMHQPEILVDVLAYNSKMIYVVADGGGSGESVVRLPFTGNETVLDAIAQVEGLSEVSSKNIWVARPSPATSQVAQTMPVDWRAITQDAVTTTNYQLLPGDRIYIKADHMIATDNFIAKFTVPMSRIFGVTLLGNGTVQALKRGPNSSTGGFN